MIPEIASHPSEHAPWLWAPGVSGNPNGRPKRGQTYWDKLIKMVDDHAGDIANAMFKKMLTGDVRAHEYFSDRTIGKPADKLIHADVNDPGTVLLMQMAQMLGYRLEPTEASTNPLMEMATESMNVIDTGAEAYIAGDVKVSDGYV